MNDDDLREIARKRLKKQADFKQFLWVALAISVILTVIWALTSPGGYFWPAWAIFGLAIGLFFGGIDAYGKESRYITDEQVEAEMQRMKGKTPPSE